MRTDGAFFNGAILVIGVALACGSVAFTIVALRSDIPLIAKACAVGIGVAMFLLAASQLKMHSCLRTLGWPADAYELARVRPSTTAPKYTYWFWARMSRFSLVTVFAALATFAVLAWSGALGGQWN
jgi:hypothetical protein